METVLATQMVGMVSAAAAQTALILLARRLRVPWVYGYSILILVLASALCWGALIDLRPAIPWLTAALIAGAVVSALWELRLARAGSTPQKTPIDQKPGPPWLKLVDVLVVLGLAITILYAAFPRARPDAWVYHLSTSKWITLFGPLASQTIYDDHAFFTGAYEFLFLIPRLFTADEGLLTAFGNCFSMFGILVLLYGVLGQIQNPPSPARRVVWLGIFAFVLPTQRHIMNLKVEPFLLGWAALATLPLLHLTAHRDKWRLLGFLLAAPLVMKLTWVHAAITLSIAIVVCGAHLNRHDRRKLALHLLQGGSAGVLLCLPLWIKNSVFFGNPIHPQQLGPLTSTWWDDNYTLYWQNVSGAAHSLSEYGATLAYLPFDVWRAAPFLWIIVAAAAYIHRSKVLSSKVLAPAVVCIALWPVFYRSDIYPRFYYPLLGIMIPGIALAASKTSRFWLGAVGLLALLTTSSVEVKLKEMAEALPMSLLDYYGQDNDYRVAVAHTTINTHRSANGIEHGLVVSDNNWGIYGDRPTIFTDGADFRLHWQAFSKSNSCIWDFLATHSIAYAYRANRSIASWPSDLQPLWKYGETLQGENEIRYYPSALLAARPGCLPAQS